MSRFARLFLGIMTVFIIGMSIEDPDSTNRPVELRQFAFGYGVVEQADD